MKFNKKCKILHVRRNNTSTRTGGLIQTASGGSFNLKHPVILGASTHLHYVTDKSRIQIWRMKFKTVTVNLFISADAA